MTCCLDGASDEQRNSQEFQFEVLSFAEFHENKKEKKENDITWIENDSCDVALNMAVHQNFVLFSRFTFAPVPSKS